MRISDWSSDVCSSDLAKVVEPLADPAQHVARLVIVGLAVVIDQRDHYLGQRALRPWHRHKGAWNHLGLVVGVAIREANAVRVMAFAHGVEYEDRAEDGEPRLDQRAKLGDGVALAADDTGENGEAGVEGTRDRKSVV